MPMQRCGAFAGRVPHERQMDAHGETEPVQVSEAIRASSEAYSATNGKD